MTLGVNICENMWMRNIKLSENEFYHIYNRGVDKRILFMNKRDFDRFVESMRTFNTLESVGNLDRNKKNKEREKLVDFVAYCVNQNHFHFILTPLTKGGIEKFMHKLCMGYSKYFNAKHKRSGALFQGKFKAIHIDTDKYLLHLSAYVNLNNNIHQQKGDSRSSWDEYLKETPDSFCKKDIILGNFKNSKEYEKFAKETMREIIEKRMQLKRQEYEFPVLTLGVNRKI